MDQKINYITYIVVMSSLVAAFLLFIIVDLVLIYRGKKKLLEEQMRMEKQLFTQRIEQQENKNLQTILDALEEERERIAADLHDRVGAGISTTKLYFESVKDLLKESDKSMRDNFVRLEEMLSKSVQEVREVSKNITSGVLSDFGFKAAILDLQETINDSGNITMSVDFIEFSERLEKTVEINLYRVIQELVNNTIKHAQASEIVLKIHKKGNVLTLIYTDDGLGFDPKLVQSGMGQRNLVQRIKSIKGRLQNNSATNKGAEYVLTLALSHE
ncbi:MAG: hypothetical protein COA58_05230 [Bacteroidetes bacterium]|nr:MAG: hypothetical protein COA58_05230 [Bacteroidota bacterium]